MVLIKYRVIHKSLRDFRPLRYSSRDGHAEGDHVNRGTDTPSFCPTLQVRDMCTRGDAAAVNLSGNQVPATRVAASPRVHISSTCKVWQKLGMSLPLLTCSPSAWPTRLLYCRGRKSRRDLWITLYKASQARTIYQYKNIKTKVMKCCANIYFNRQCLNKKLVPNYAKIKVPLTSPAASQTTSTIVVFIHWFILILFFFSKYNQYFMFSSG
jgi:hypothetical protein